MTDTAEGPVAETEDGPIETDASVADASSTDTNFEIMLVSGVSFELPSPTPVMTLKQSATPYRTLEIPIALPEAQALGQAIHALPGTRPGTHELFAKTLLATGTEIVAVRITRFDSGVYYAEIDLVNASGRSVIDCRPTDGVILALRQPVYAPILCESGVLAAQAVR
jgi:bifunctional DNase/RNase